VRPPASVAKVRGDARDPIGLPHRPHGLKG